MGSVRECACLSLLHLAVRKGDSRLQQSPRGLSARKCFFLSYWQPFDLAGAQLAGSAAKEPGGPGEGRVRGRQIPLQAQALGAGPMTGLPAGWLLPTTPLWLLLLLGLLSSHKGEFWRPSTTLPSQEKDVQRRSSSWQSKNHRTRAISGPCPSACRSPGYSWRAP